MIEDRLEAAGGGTINLEDPPTQLVSTITDLTHAATSWVMVTPGRIPPWALASMGRSDVAGLAISTALLTGHKTTGAGTELQLSGLSHYLTDAAGQTEAGITPGNFVGTGKSLTVCMDKIVGGGGYPTLSNVRRGLAIRGIGSPSTVDLDGEHHDSLGFARWLANAFIASWRVILKSTAEGMWPHLDIAPLGDLWGEDLLTTTIISPDLASSPPATGTWCIAPTNGACRIVRGSVRREGDATGLISDPWVHPAEKYEGIPATVGRATVDLNVQHVNGLGALPRHKRFTSTVKLASAAQLNAAAARVVAVEGKPVESWEVDIVDPGDLLRVPLGLPVGLMDVAAGVWDPAAEASVGAHGAAPIVGTRVIARKLPWVEGMGCYLAHAGTGESWRVIDLSPWVAEEQGSIEVARTTGRMSLADALSGTARI